MIASMHADASAAARFFAEVMVHDTAASLLYLHDSHGACCAT